MPEKATLEKAKEDLREGKSPSTAAGEFVHEEIEHVRQGKHGARSPQQVDGWIGAATVALTPADLEAAWEYAAAHREEIDQAIRENEDGVEGFVE